MAYAGSRNFYTECVVGLARRSSGNHAPSRMTCLDLAQGVFWWRGVAAPPGTGRPMASACGSVTHARVGG